MARVVLITGANLGPVAENLAEAVRLLAETVGRIVLRSSLRESEPWGFEADERFLNQVLAIETPLSPERVLDECQRIERILGRVRTPDTGYRSRTMDIDMLFYEDRVIRSERLTIPHPLLERRDSCSPRWRRYCPISYIPCWDERSGSFAESSRPDMRPGPEQGRRHVPKKRRQQTRAEASGPHAREAP